MPVPVIQRGVVSLHDLDTRRIIPPILPVKVPGVGFSELDIMVYSGRGEFREPAN